MKRSRLSWRTKQRRESSPWLPRRIREDAAGMHRLRREAFRRAGGRCEIETDGKRCNVYAAWDGMNRGELWHKVHRGMGGSDELDNVLWSCRACHKKRHPGPQWSKKAIA